MAQKSRFWHFYHIQDLATQSLLTSHCLMIVNIYVNFIPASNEGVTDRAIYFITLTLNCDLDLGHNHTVVVHAHCLLTAGINFMSSYIKFLQVMMDLWTGQAILSHLTLNCDFDIGPSQMLFVHCTANYDNTHAKFHVIPL